MNYTDHAGRVLKRGDSCLMDAGHAHCDDWKGSIVRDMDGSLAFLHEDKELGFVTLAECHHLLELVE